MSEPRIDPALARGASADLQEQTIEVVPDDDLDEGAERAARALEADLADVLEQQRPVGGDDERDEEHQR